MVLTDTVIWNVTFQDNQQKLSDEKGMSVRGKKAGNYFRLDYRFGGNPRRVNYLPPSSLYCWEFSATHANNIDHEAMGAGVTVIPHMVGNDQQDLFSCLFCAHNAHLSLQTTLWFNPQTSL